MVHDDEARAEAASTLGTSVVEATALGGGHTGQLVERLALADGRVVVLKAAKTWAAGGGLGSFAIRTEIELYGLVPTLARWRPARIATFETVRWLGLVMENRDQ